MNRRSTALAAALALAALLLPVRSVAVLLLGAAAPSLAQVATGVWIFKGMLLVHAVLVAVLARYGPPAGALWSVPRREAAPRAAPWERAALLLLLGVAALLRLYDLGDGLWFDEIDTLVRYVRLPLGQIVATFDSQNQHMLYSVLARVSLASFGESAWALRLPAALLGMASVGALYWFASQVTGRREALLATALLTFSYHHIWFSQNARGYTGLLLWTLLGSGLFLRLIREGEPRGWGTAAAYGASMALALYTHATALLIVAAHVLIWVWLALRARGRGAGRDALVPLVGFVLAGTFALQLYALVLPQFLDTLLQPTMEGVATSWKDPFWFLSETVQVLAAGVPGGLLTVAVSLLVAAAGVVSYWRQDAALAGIMLAPGLVTAAVLVAMEHNLWPRFFFFAAGFAVLIAVRGALALGGALLAGRGRAAAFAALIVVAAGSAFTVPTAYHPKQDYHGAREFIRRVSAPADAVVTVDMSEYIYRRYLEPALSSRGAPPRGGCAGAQNHSCAGPGWLAVADARQLSDIEARHPRTWLVYTFPTRLSAVYPDIWSRIESGYTTAATFPGTVGGGTIVVKVNR